MPRPLLFTDIPSAFCYPIDIQKSFGVFGQLIKMSISSSERKGCSARFIARDIIFAPAAAMESILCGVTIIG
jgi:hypothetical protein